MYPSLKSIMFAAIVPKTKNTNTISFGNDKSSEPVNENPIKTIKIDANDNKILEIIGILLSLKGCAKYKKLLPIKHIIRNKVKKLTV